METSYFVAILGTAPENVAKAEPALVQQLERIRSQPASAEEVAVGRAYVLGSQAMDRRTNARQAWYLAFYEIAGVGYEFLDRYAADVKKVTPADLQRVAQKYLSVLRTVIVQPKLGRVIACSVAWSSIPVLFTWPMFAYCTPGKPLDGATGCATISSCVCLL